MFLLDIIMQVPQGPQFKFVFDMLRQWCTFKGHRANSRQEPLPQPKTRVFIGSHTSMSY